jgi:hypothetical protein
MSLTELALLDGRRPLPLGDVIGLTLTLYTPKDKSKHFWTNQGRYLTSMPKLNSLDPTTCMRIQKLRCNSTIIFMYVRSFLFNFPRNRKLKKKRKKYRTQNVFHIFLQILLKIFFDVYLSNYTWDSRGKA